jgi:hypothetical protein
MNPNTPPSATAWTRLAEAARRAQFDDVRNIPAPYGFATRVAARALSLPPTSAGPFFVAKLTLRVLGVACLLAIVSVTINLGAILCGIDEAAGDLGNTSIEAVEVENSADNNTPTLPSDQTI